MAQQSFSARTVQKLPLFGPAYQNADEVENNEDPVVLYDGWRDEKGGVHRRPGLLAFVDLQTNQPIDAMYWWSKENKIVAISNGHVFTVTANGTYTDHSGATFPIGARVIFSTNGDYLVMAGGGPMIYLNLVLGVTTATYITDPQAPTNSTHVGFVNGYTVANNFGSDQFNWSAINNPLAWAALDFATAEGGPDFVDAFIIKDAEITFFGKESIESWEDVGDSTTFSRVPGGFLQEGTNAPYSIVSDENFLFWLGINSDFHKYAGRGIEKVSSPYDKILQEFITISDCYAQRLDIVGRTFLIFIFPTENRTLVYNITNDSWAEWGKWNPATTEYDRWLGNCLCYSPSFRVNLVGGRTDSIIYNMSQDFLTDNGEYIRLCGRSGHIDHGASVRKRNNKLRLRAKRGASSDLTTESFIDIRWRDNNSSSWSDTMQVSLGAAGDTLMPLVLEPRGNYRTRQWEISSTDVNTEIILVDAEEDFDFLAN